ncbi:uncharacterized protein LOC124168344 [Ischnura elegans]|uniref:uncharacterized protein LOC124168344 n=1 Tax=Ischnura elegans TaxID=197161 RepID=UPI001ED892B2|nr:uncharacterized protein LOC124168344 [Ischnura elegans]
MAAAGNESLRNTVSIFPMGGNIYFAVYLHEIDSTQPTTKNLEDAVFAIKFFKNLGCKIFSGEDSPIDDVEASQSNEDVSSDDSPDEFEEDSRKGDDSSSNYKNFVIFNQSLQYTVSDLELFAKGDYGASCFIFYFIVPQVGSKFLTFDESDLNVFQLWKIIRKPSIPVIFLIQGNFTGNASNPSVLLNTGTEEDKGPTIAESANVLLAIIPNPGNLDVPVIKILTDELSKNLDIQTCLTNFNRVLTGKGCKPTPRFGSTLNHHLYLPNGKTVGLQEKYGRKYVAYAFLFGKFAQKPGQKISDLTEVMKKDKESLNVFKDRGVELEFCVRDGKMTTEEFKKKLDKIMQSDDLDSCDGIFIIVSSHGSKNLLTRTYDGVFSTEYIQHKLATCTKLKDKPKVIIRDACRGSHKEGRVPYGAYVPRGGERKDWPVPQGTSMNMNDIIIALGSVEGTVASYDDVGSTFIYHLCEMIREHDELDFQTILTLTMNEVSSKGHKQQVTFTSGLQKLLHLPKVKSQ